jgi:hypothetical protein
MTGDVEAQVAWHIARRAVVVGPMVIAAAWATRGVDGAAAAAIGVGIVVGNFLVSGWLLSAAAKISLGLYHAVALVGFVLRFVFITIAMLVVARLFDIDRVAFGIAAVVSYLVLLVLEAAAIGRREEKARALEGMS